ncbi:coenzyme F420-0:L-glutamate ligase [Patescibacteria group bacterium]|nr:coenzyme F420-0:L-glutamate ligase [Patescibacteria group bacterium]MBU0963930.1 coenzyme F420-0:L-glutamate ligase [Patescibacteria group bacterium]
MQIKPIKTKILKPPQNDLFKVIKKSIKRLSEKSVVVIASKVVSIHQGRCVLKSVVDKDELIKKEADRFLPRNKTPRGAAVLTIKNNILIPNAGIDESNSGDYYILWPNQPQKAAQEIWQFLRQAYKVKRLGVIISDSHTVPLRRGVMGVAVGYYGFEPVKDYRGTKDLFKRKFKISTVDVADSLAAAAMVVMGEGREQTPLAIITDVPFVRFNTRSHKSNPVLKINPNEDLYRPLLKSVKWK